MKSVHPVVLSLLLACSVCAPVRATPGEHGSVEVIFDQSNDQLFSPFDTGFAGMSELSLFLDEGGYVVSLNSQPLEDLLPLRKAQRTILFLGVGIFRKYSAGAQRAVSDFVEKGGAILVLAEHDDLLENASMQNDLIGSFGITVLPKAIVTDSADTPFPQWIRADFPQFGVQKALLYFPAPLAVRAPARVLGRAVSPASPDLSIVAAAAERGRGRLMVISDAEMVWNGATGCMGIHEAENRKLMAESVRFLSGREAAKVRQVPFHSPAVTAPVRGKVLFETPASMMNDTSLSGLFQFARALAERGYEISLASEGIDYGQYDLVVVAGQLAPLPRLERVPKARKVMLIADGQSDLLGSDADIKQFLGAFAKRDISQKEPPVNAVAGEFSLRFPSVTLVSERDNHLEVGAETRKGRPFLVHRSTYIAPLGDRFPEGVRIVAASEARSWPQVSLLLNQNDEEKARSPFDVPPDIDRLGRYPVIVSSERVFALADAEPLSNQYFGTTDGTVVFEALLDWLGAK